MARRQKEQQAIFLFSGLLNLFTVTVAMDVIARTTLWTNQVGYITLIAQLPGINGNVNQPCPQAHPMQMGYNYYMHHMITIPAIVWLDG